MSKMANMYSLLSGHGIKGLIRKVVAMIRALGPYALIELVLPAGSLIVALLWLYRRSRGRHWNAAGAKSVQMVAWSEHARPNPTDCCFALERESLPVFNLVADRCAGSARWKKRSAGHR
jgi:hypothetical protein